MRAAIVFILYALTLIVMLPVLLVCAIFGLRKPVLAVAREAIRAGRLILGIRIDVSGLENFDRRSAYVFMPNHLSLIDGPLMYLVIPQYARVILKKSVFGVPILGWAMAQAECVPVDRKGWSEGKKSIERAVRLMREKDYSFLIFPEGTRSLDGKLQALRRGGFFLAIQSGRPIVPVSIRGSFDLMPKGKFRVRKGTVGVSFHPPIPVEGKSIADIPGLLAEVRAAIQSGL